MVRMVSYSLLRGKFMMKSRAIVSNGSVSGGVLMGYSGGFGCVVLLFVDWQIAHPFTNSATSVLMLGHQ